MNAPFDAGPFHAGELAAQELAGGGALGHAIRDFMPAQHRDFFARLPFILAATLDAEGPVATLLTGPPGFVGSPDPRHLAIAGPLPAGDPVTPLLVPGAPVGLLGIELPTRRRNRANGHVAEAGPGRLSIAIEQSFGNCPQYIRPRAIAAAPAASGPVRPLAGLDAAAHALLARAETVFVASGNDAQGVDISHRGGPPGFIAVEGDRLAIPDYRGNRYFNTLGNLLLEPRAALLVPDFDTGAVLQLRGRTEILWREQRVWTFAVTGGWWRDGGVLEA